MLASPPEIYFCGRMMKTTLELRKRPRVPDAVQQSPVIASQRVGAKRHPITGSAKQSRKLDCFVRFAPRNDSRVAAASGNSPFGTR
jgi:hypothetical protein